MNPEKNAWIRREDATDFNIHIFSNYGSCLKFVPHTLHTKNPVKNPSGIRRLYLHVTLSLGIKPEIPWERRGNCTMATALVLVPMWCWVQEMNPDLRVERLRVLLLYYTTLDFYYQQTYSKNKIIDKNKANKQQEREKINKSPF